ncbi:MAG TPA: BrnT family toxin [Azospirillaceae bacterium]|nr:BrnT family toxin [Azospirillaceae bacterium]
MDFEWDDAKRLVNLRKHGVDFEDAIRIWEGAVLEAPDRRRDYGEEQFIALGMVDGRVLAVV